MMRQYGQSMTEFAAGSAVLGLMLLGAVALAGYQEVDRRNALAARQSAWLHSWKPQFSVSEAELDFLHDDLFSDQGVVDASGRHLLVDREDLALQGGSGSPDGVAGASTQILLAPLRVASGFLGSGFDLSSGGLVRGHVRARIEPLARLPEPFRSLELHLQTPFALLGDAWHSGSVRQVRSRAGGLVPASRLAALNALWQPLSVPLGILEPSLRELCFGLIEPDRIPEDRLGPGRTPSPRDCP
jgi:hypothetical protein